MNEVIGVNDHELIGYKPDSPLSGFVADIMLAKGRSLLAQQKEHQDNHPSISIINIRGLRTSLKKGNITVGNILKVMPFENLLVALLMTGNDMEELFELIAESNGDGIAGATCDLTASGMRNIKVNGESLNKDSLYWVFVSDYIADGGDHYSILQKYVKRIDFPKKINEIMIEYIQEQKDINYTYDIRINKIDD
jgi:2',3'-cyclic-nucleotide 2'-phosphodiesterase (5'-nucleotidase family)